MYTQSKYVFLFPVMKLIWPEVELQNIPTLRMQDKAFPSAKGKYLTKIFF